MDISYLLKVYPEERAKVYILLLHGLSMGIFHCIVAVVPLALFLQVHSTDTLPYIYIGASLSSLAAGFAYYTLENRIAFYSLLSLLLGFLLLPLLALNTLAFFSSAPWVSFCLLLWGQLCWRLSDLEFWGLLSRVLTLQQAKRLFGVIGAMTNIGYLATGFLIPVFRQFINAETILFIGSLSLIVCQATLTIIHRMNPAELESNEVEPDKDEQESSTRLGSIFERITPYMFHLLAIGFLLNVSYYSIDMIFNQVSKDVFVTESRMTEFFGIFFAIANALEFCCRIFVLPFVLRHFGVITASLILPTMTCVFLFLALSAKFVTFEGAGMLFVAAILCCKMADESIRFSISDPVKSLLYQPLSPNSRMWMLTTNEAVVEPVASTITALCLIIISAFFADSSTVIILGTAFITLLCFIYFRSIKKTFLETLSNAIRGMYFHSDAPFTIDKSSFDIYKRHLDSFYPGEAIYSLESLLTLDAENKDSYLRQTLKHPSSLVKGHVCQKIADYRCTGLKDDVREVLLKETKLEAKEAAIKAYTSIASEEELETIVVPLLKHKEKAVQGAAIEGLLASPYPSAKQQGITALERLRQSNDPGDRIKALSIYNAYPQITDSSVIYEFIQSNNVEEIRAVLNLIGLKSEVGLTRYLIDALEDPRYNEAASKALMNLGSNFIDYFIQNYAYFTPLQRSLCMDVIVAMDLDMSSVDKLTLFLLDRVTSSEKSYIQKILEFFRKFTNRSPEVSDKLMTYTKARKALTMQIIQRIMSVSTQFSNEEEESLLRKTLHGHLSIEEKNLLNEIAIIHPQVRYKDIVLGLGSGEEERVSYALELLHNTLNDKSAEKVVSLLEELHHAEHQVIKKSKDKKQILSEIIIDNEGVHSDISRSVALYIFRKYFDTKDFKHDLSHDSSALVKETYTSLFLSE